MTAAVAAGVLLIFLPIAFNTAFALLASRFDYPDVLRRPTHEVLERFRSGGSSLVLLWWAFALTAVCLVPLAVLTSAALQDADPTVLSLATTMGVLAGVVQFLGLVRWPFLVPHLARVAETSKDPAELAAVDLVFQSFNRYLGVAVGEHLGYLFTGAWSVLVGVMTLQSNEAPGWIGVIGIVVGVLLAICSLEFVGGNEQRGWTVAEKLTPPTYVAWSFWLVILGVAILV